MDIYNGYSYPFQHGGDVAIHDLVDCDIKDLDINYNDPSFEPGQYTDAVFHQHLKSDKFHGTLPADLTNLQWLQNMNVAIPVDQNTAVNQQLHDSVMVDPNTAMPVQNMNGWASQNSVQVQSIHPQHAAQRRVMDKPKKSTNIPITAKNDKNHKEKTYPKPVFSYSCLIAMALQASDAGTLPVSEIYKFMQ